MPACQCCGSESKRLKEFVIDYKDDLFAHVCPNCYEECLGNAKAIRRTLSRVAFILAAARISIESATEVEIATALRVLK